VAGSAVFAVFPKNFQWSTSHPPRKSWAASGLAVQKTARTTAVPPLFFAVFHDTKIRIVVKPPPPSHVAYDAMILESAIYVNSQNSVSSTTTDFLAVAAVPKVRELVVVTVNQRHFDMLGVEAFNPFAPP
jgi:hypothetical protein